MSKVSDNHSIDNEGKSSNVIIISKSRLSSSKRLHNFMTIQDGELKLKVRMNKKTLTKEDINKTITNLKNNMKSSRTFGKYDYDQSKIDSYLVKRNNNHELNKKKILEKMKKSNLSVETTRSCNVIKTTDSKEEDNIYNNDNDKVEDVKENNERETIDININEENNKNYNKINSNASKVYYSQNFANNSRNNKKLIKLKQINNHVSEEINIKYSDELNSKKDNINDKNNQQSDKTFNEQAVKHILESIMPHSGEKFRENLHINTQNLITESDNDQLYKSKNALISENINQENNENEKAKLENDDDDNEQNNINFNIINLNNNEDDRRDSEDKKIQSTKNNLEEQQTINNENDKNNDDNKKVFIRSIVIKQNNNKRTHQICEICDFTYTLDKFFLPECNQHYICKKCTKNYYEEKIEEGIKDLFCPFIKCGSKINIKDLQKFISSEHYKRLNTMNQKEKNNYDDNKSSFYFTKIKTDINKSNIQSYTKRNVIDINTNKDFFNYNSIRGGYCPQCYEESLFSKTNTRFYKCLNCEIRICKMCFKPFTVNHLEINNLEHCKVFYRIEENENFRQKKIFFNLLLQIFFVFASFFICFGGSFFFFRDIFFCLFNINNRNVAKYIFGYFFIIIFFIISIPFIFLMYPYFPSIMALFN